MTPLSFRASTAVLVALVLALLVSCNQDPAAASRKFVENGNKYFARGKYREASIMYRNAIKKDGKNGEAYYQLALTSIRTNDLTNAVRPLRQSLDTLPEGEHKIDAKLKLSEIFLKFAFFRLSQPQTNFNELDQLLAVVEDGEKALIAKEPNSFEAYRLRGERMLAAFIADRKRQNNAHASENLKQALLDLSKANEIRPLDPEVGLSLAGVLVAESREPEAEKLYRAIVEKHPQSFEAYRALFGYFSTRRRFEEAESLLKSGAAANPSEQRYLIALAEFYQSLRRDADMASVLDRMKANLKTYPEAYRASGNIYFRAQQYDQAIREYDAGLKVDPGNAAKYQKGKVETLLAMGRRTEAEALNDAVLKANKNDAEARALRGALLLDRNDRALLPEALKEMEEAILTLPEHAPVRYNLARGYMARGEWDRARVRLQEAVQLNPRYIVAQSALAQIEMARADYELAMKATDAILAAEPGSETAGVLKGAIYLAMNKPDTAKKQLQSTIEAHPKSANAWFQMGLVYARERDYKGADNAFRKAAELNPQDARGALGVAETFLQQKQNGAALSSLESEVRKNPGNVMLRQGLISAAIRLDKLDMAMSEAKALLEQVKNKPADRAEVLLRMAEVYRRQGNFAESVKTLQQAAAARPGDPRSVSSLAVMLDATGDWKQAMERYEEALRLDGENAAVLNNLAYLLADHGLNLDRALALAQKAKQKDPKNPEMDDTLGWVYYKKNLTDSAIESFETSLKGNPASASIRYHLGLALLQKNDKTRAKRELESALGNRPSPQDAARIREALSKIG